MSRSHDIPYKIYLHKMFAMIFRTLRRNDPKGVGFTSTFISQPNLLFRFTFLDRYTPTA